ncbi:hypothetical protein [Neptuniibacter sp.]|uniref:hypothetical protein n=1 Tax=Neptuniibacter sp. TaxID=1962643 RepID=UPI00261E39F8|nr:hypothetical protein [Neptuniibacter sp.]MCP4598503.1 hypothetical protein [Neptuniibacter sp.]
MKKFKLDLSEYEVAVGDGGKLEAYPLKDNLHQWLRFPGTFNNGVEICDACDIAKRIKQANDELILDEYEIGLLRTTMNKLIAQDHNPSRGIMALGGSVHEEAIRRVFRPEKVD